MQTFSILKFVACMHWNRTFRNPACIITAKSPRFPNRLSSQPFLVVEVIYYGKWKETNSFPISLSSHFIRYRSIFHFRFFLSSHPIILFPDFFRRRACQKALNSSPKKWSFSFAGNLVRKLPCISMRLAQFLTDFLLVGKLLLRPSMGKRGEWIVKCFRHSSVVKLDSGKQSQW